MKVYQKRIPNKYVGHFVIVLFLSSSPVCRHTNRTTLKSDRGQVRYMGPPHRSHSHNNENVMPIFGSSKCVVDSPFFFIFIRSRK